MINRKRINLVDDTIDKEDIDKLIVWLQDKPHLTKGKLTVEFEKKWSEWLGTKYSVFLNSGSSANLAAIYALIISKRLKNNKIIVPAVSWVTTVSPAIQFGLQPILCDSNMDNLGLDLNHLKQIIEKEQPSALILVHVLGFPNDMNEIMELCDKHNIMVIEDTCEAQGSMYNGKKLGSIGDMGTFSFYFGHMMSTIEGGMISTNDEDLYHLLLMIRSHGWDRDLPKEKVKELRDKYNIPEFRGLYTFYHPAFNLRSTDLQAFLGIEQLKNTDWMNGKRNENYKLYDSLIKNDYWKIKAQDNTYISNMNYPIITTKDKIQKLIDSIKNNNIETRPLICGSINQQPFWYERYGKSNDVPNADYLHEYGLYLPNNHQISKEDITFICDVVNKTLND